uniref:Uncharacterized protein n=1 Tax=Aegilops tauschii subsp. strangulata TaxID=200361 RepID=A0A453LGX5_AEGTS
ARDRGRVCRNVPSAACTRRFLPPTHPHTHTHSISPPLEIPSRPRSMAARPASSAQALW